MIEAKLMMMMMAMQIMTIAVCPTMAAYTIFESNDGNDEDELEIAIVRTNQYRTV